LHKVCKFFPGLENKADLEEDARKLADFFNPNGTPKDTSSAEGILRAFGIDISLEDPASEGDNDGLQCDEDLNFCLLISCILYK
jgi:hypothetical protein